MKKFTYVYDAAMNLQTTAGSKEEADERLERFNQGLNEVAYKTGFVLNKGKAIQCFEADAA